MKIQPLPYAEGGRIASLPADVTPEEIDEILPGCRVSDDDPDKVTHSWAAKIDGLTVAIWDYCGARWSVGGSPAGAQKLADALGVELEG